MRFESFTFGSVQIEGVTYEHDLIIDRGEIRKRNKKASKKYRGAYGHTPLTAEEDIPWHCHQLVVGTGADGGLPVTDEVRKEAHRRKVELLSLQTKDAIAILNRAGKDTNAILHVTC
ncbi:MAG: MTH938/NDUFAF3 family protein [Candidatus Dormiibacterota bacterium]